uniref:Hyaluronan-mediated motility receptor (RHAMM) n=1 Tax=Sander lucioperca TaxID=283035 RepID=A0A8C9ZHA2_SANLU
MSFSRAPLKRFNEDVGCAPPPGSYEIKPGDLKGAASFDKSDRFRLVKAAAMPPPSPSRSFMVSPVRRTMSVDGLVEGSSVKKKNAVMTMERKQQQLLEKEIRSLVQQRGEQDRRLLALEDELKKAEAKLLAAVREKTGLAANVATLDRQRAELKKVNEFLKNKVSADTTKKKINSLTMELMEARNTVDVKNKELNVLQINTEGQVKVLETDLQAARATGAALKDRNKDLEDLHQVTKTQNEELENENARLHAVIRELREEISIVQGYLDAANDQIQLETIQYVLGQKEEEAQQLQQELQVSKDALVKVEKRLEHQELELKSSQRSVSDMEEQLDSANQEVQESQATVRQQEAELARLREVLRRTEKELDERVAHLEQRCLFSEEERSKTQEEGIRRVEELKKELILLKEAKRDEKKREIQLGLEHAALTEELTKEKVTRALSHMALGLLDYGNKIIIGKLLEVQTRLAQKDEEIKALEASHAALIHQLQWEREEELGQLEEQRGQGVILLQNEKEKGRKLLEEVSQEKGALLEQLQHEREERVKIQTALQEERAALEAAREDHQQVRSEALRLQADSQSSETEHWRKQYEELFTKVRPFQEQLNAFAAERNALLNENGANQEELNKLSDAYARLLGHQNQKQKIKHVMKLKDENISLKQEVSKLRSQVSRQKSDLEQLKSKLPGSTRRRFDPSKAFQHDKENRRSESLKEGEY